ncbi:MAG: hypothetical protein ACSLE6_06835 [Mycobacterium sp.]
MRNGLRILGFDILAPVAALAAFVVIGIAMGWPLWWVSVCSVLSLLVVQGVVINFVLSRRDKVTVGTDDDGPALRLVVVGVTTAALVAAVSVCYLHWTRMDDALRADSTEVVNIASSVAEATTTFSPQDPTSSLDRAESMLAPDYVEQFRADFGVAVSQLVTENVTAQYSTVSAGVEAIGSRDASVAVSLRGIQTAPGEERSVQVVALRIFLVKQDEGGWLVSGVVPINSL